MITKILIFTISYFLIGSAVTILANRIKKVEPEAQRQRWVKYFTYVFIVHFLLFVICCQGYYFLILAIVIALIGLFELIKNYISSSIGSIVFLGISLTVYLILASGFILFSTFDYELILSIYLLVIVFDGFSQITGQLLGKRKLISISPNKTIEGLAGGFLVTIITAIFIMQSQDQSLYNSVLSACIVSFSSLTGDLLASWYKRKVGIKDYSRLIPGHGGILDRFDSFIATGAFWYGLHLFAVV